MCESLVDNTSTVRLLRSGQEEKDRKKKKDKKKLQGKNIMAPLLHRAAIIRAHLRDLLGVTVKSNL